MKKSLKISIVAFLLLGIYSCSKNNDEETIPIDTDEYYSDSSGKYVIQLGNEGYNVYVDGNPYENPTSSRASRGTNELKLINGYLYPYKGICILPPTWPRSNNNPQFSSFPNKPTPSKKTVTSNLKTIGGGYRVTPKPSFLGGSNYECFECLVNSIPRDEYFVGVCNGSVFISGSLSDDPAFQSIKETLSGINFDPNQSAQFVQGITSSGLYNCSKR